MDFSGTNGVSGQNSSAVLVQLAAKNLFAGNQNVVGKLRDVSISRVSFTIEELEGQFNRDIFITNRSGHLGPRSVVNTNDINANDDVGRPSAGVTNTVGELIELVIAIVGGIRRSKIDDTSLRIVDEDRNGGNEVGGLGTSSIELVETTNARSNNNLGQNGINAVGGKTSQAEDGTVELVVVVKVVLSELDVTDGSKRRVIQDISDGGSTKTRGNQSGSLGFSRVGSERNAETSTHVGGKTGDTLGEAVDNVTFRGKIGDHRNLGGSQVDSLGDSKGQITAVGLNGDDKTEAQF